MTDDELAEALERLADLLRHPEPGLGTWHMACSELGEALDNELRVRLNREALRLVMREA
jgi:hypothetical protein